MKKITKLLIAFNFCVFLFGCAPHKQKYEFMTDDEGHQVLVTAN